MVHYLLNWFVAVSFCLVFVSFAFCYTFVPMVSYRKNGQMRSLSGIMKASDYKPYFCTVMGCLGGSLFLSVGMRSYQEDTNFKQNFSMALSIGMYMCMIGISNYDVASKKVFHFTFVFILMAFGYLFCNTVLTRDENRQWNFVAVVGYNIFTSIFLFCVIGNGFLQTQGFTNDYHTVQTWFEFSWILFLILTLCVYAFDDTWLFRPTLPQRNHTEGGLHRPKVSIDFQSVQTSSYQWNQTI